MLIKRKQHEVPELNTVSTADISFMLLIFFLVTTSMNVDKGLRGRLPHTQKTERALETEVNKAHLLTIELSESNAITVNNAAMAMDSLADVAADFILKNGNRHVIYLQTAANSTYQTYFRLQNELSKAYRTARNTLAQQRYGTTFELCDEVGQEEINKELPQRIAEKNEPNEKGGAP